MANKDYWKIHRDISRHVEARFREEVSLDCTAELRAASKIRIEKEEFIIAGRRIYEDGFEAGRKHENDALHNRGDQRGL